MTLLLFNTQIKHENKEEDIKTNTAVYSSAFMVTYNEDMLIKSFTKYVLFL